VSKDENTVEFDGETWTIPASFDSLPIPAVQAWTRLVASVRDEGDAAEQVGAVFDFLEGLLGRRQWRRFSASRDARAANDFYVLAMSSFGERDQGE